MSQGMQSIWSRSWIEDSSLWLRAWSSRKATEAANPLPCRDPTDHAILGITSNGLQICRKPFEYIPGIIVWGWKYVLRHMLIADANNHQPWRLRPHINDSCAICVFCFDIAHEKPATVEEDVDGSEVVAQSTLLRRPS